MKKLTQRAKSVIGMVHVRALPGTPRYEKAVAEVAQVAVEEARQLEAAGFDAVRVENMHDMPFLKRQVGPEIVAAMAVIVKAVVDAVKVPVGVQVLAGANKEALAVAAAAGARFIRVEGLLFAHVADEGLIESDAGELFRYRRMIDAQHVLILADIKKKHSSHAITGDVSLRDTASAAEFIGADAVIVTGTATGRPTSLTDLAEAEQGSQLPVLVGSGATPEMLRELWHAADGIIVGSYLKRDGNWSEPLDAGRIQRFMQAVTQLRKTIPDSPYPTATEIY